MRVDCAYLEFIIKQYYIKNIIIRDRTTYI
jgi:hypothetical protein